MVTDAYKWRQVCSDPYGVKNKKYLYDDETLIFEHSPGTE
jgi:hypothetical protein